MMKSINKNGGPEREIETAASASLKRQRRERFLKGPIEWHIIQHAACLPGKALALYLTIRHRIDLEGRPVVTLSDVKLEGLGIGKDSKMRALCQLERAGLINVSRFPGRAPLVKLSAGARS